MAINRKIARKASEPLMNAYRKNLGRIKAGNVGSAGIRASQRMSVAGASRAAGTAVRSAYTPRTKYYNPQVRSTNPAHPFSLRKKTR